MKPGVTVVTPTIPTRGEFLAEAIVSVAQQSHLPVTHVVTVDHRCEGEATTRNRGLFAVETEWVAFLDDDDLLFPNHLEVCLDHAQSTGADLVYPWFESRGWSETFEAFGEPFDEKRLRRSNYIPVTTLVRTELAQSVGGFPRQRSEEWPHERLVDWAFLLRLLDAGARFSHVAERTWAYRAHPGATAGNDWKTCVSA